MSVDLDLVLADLKQRYGDTRTQVLDVQPVVEAGCLHLRGRVLDEATRSALLETLAHSLPGLAVDSGGLRVLRRAAAAFCWVAANLTSLHSGTSFLTEMISQLLYGARLEVLETLGDWVFVRQDDGYLGWTYRPYLSGETPLPPTHLAVHPVSSLRAAPRPDAPVLTRLLGGAFVAVTAEQGQWVEVQANLRGWLPSARLRALAEIPSSAAEKRALIVQDGLAMTGVPYLWGGCSANGIDCSGLAQLLHRWAGITIPRDADMQLHAGQPVEPPFLAGDLIFFGRPEDVRSITHVGISLGGWQMIHSSRARNGVYIDDVQAVAHLWDSYYGACTYLGA